MIATIVHVWVKPEYRNEFIEITKLNHLNSVKEPGNLRFDILEDSTDSNKFTLYEAYETEDAAAAHKLTAHYALWRDTVVTWMAKPREGLKHNLLFA